jgi:hypothetical protein
MGTTIFPLNNGGPFDDDGPSFPVSAGQGMGFEQATRLRESRKKKTPKQIIKEAEGVLNPARSKAKKKQLGARPKNLRTSGRKKKVGPFGEAYSSAPGSRGKGVRVAESSFGAIRFAEAVLRNPKKLHKVLSRFKASKHFGESRFSEKAPAGWEGTVKHMKKHSDIDNPFALAHYMKNQGYTPHH